jgi:hypothetical protein
MKHDPYLAGHWRASRVRSSLRSKRKKDLINFLRDRYEERFFEPIRYLRNAGNLQGYGIAMMSLCSLLVESIQCLREGLPSTNRGELRRLAAITPPKKYDVPRAEWKNGDTIFKDFFADYSASFPDIDGEEFYQNIRNGLLHQAQTKNGWIIRVDQVKLCDRKRKIINRNLFAASPENAFKKYLDATLGKVLSGRERDAKSGGSSV